MGIWLIFYGPSLITIKNASINMLRRANILSSLAQAPSSSRKNMVVKARKNNCSGSWRGREGRKKHNQGLHVRQPGQRTAPHLCVCVWEHV